MPRPAAPEPASVPEPAPAAELAAEPTQEPSSPASTSDAPESGSPTPATEGGDAPDAALPPFLARMAAFVAEGSVPNGETGAFAAVAAAVEAPLDAPVSGFASSNAPAPAAASATKDHPAAGATPAPVSQDAPASKVPAPTASRLPAFLSAALSSRPVGHSIDVQGGAPSDVPATFDATIEIAPPPTLTEAAQRTSSTAGAPDDGAASRASSSRPLKRGRSTTGSSLGLPKKKPNPVEAFHERATLRIGEKPAVPPDQRPSASKPAKDKDRPRRGKRS